MSLNKPALLLILITVLIFSCILVYYFDNKISSVFSLINLDEQKRITELCLKYNKELFEIGNSYQKEILKIEFETIEV